MSLSSRLRRARKDAGYSTAAAALEHFKWPSSSYRAHENGQNKFSLAAAEQYAKAYGVSAAWLLLGDESESQSRTAKATEPKHDCIEHIRATVLLLQNEQTNLDLIDKLDACVKSLRTKALQLR